MTQKKQEKKQDQPKPIEDRLKELEEQVKGFDDLDIKSPAWSVKMADYTGMNNKDIAILVSTGIIPQGCPASRAAAFFKECQLRGLSPFSKHLYLVKYGSEFHIVTSIDGMRFLADKNGEYAGSDDYMFNAKKKYNDTHDVFVTVGVSQDEIAEETGTYEYVSQRKKQDGTQAKFFYGGSWVLKAEFYTPPRTATACVYRLVQGVRVRFSASAGWLEYFPTGANEIMWRQMPFNMLGKCAEAKALRKAFPAALGNVYLREELMQAGEVEAGTATAGEVVMVQDAFEMLREAGTVADVTAIFHQFQDMQDKMEFVEAVVLRKKEITDYAEQMIAVEKGGRNEQ